MNDRYTRRQLNCLIGVGISGWIFSACRTLATDVPQPAAPAVDGPVFLYFYTDN